MGKVPLHLEVEKVMEKMEGIQLKSPPDVLLPKLLQNSTQHFPNDESKVEVGPRTPSSSHESPKEKVFGAGEAGKVRTQQRGVSKSFLSLPKLDKQTLPGVEATLAVIHGFGVNLWKIKRAHLAPFHP